MHGYHQVTNDRSILVTKKHLKGIQGKHHHRDYTIIPNDVPDLAIAEILFDSADPSFVVHDS